MTQGRMKIVILKNGPYIVSGNVPLKEMIIVPKGGHYELVEGCSLPQSETYALCRCGKSKNPPFCDGAHIKAYFNGEETASREEYDKRAELLEGSGLDMQDDYRCAFARFCHRDKGDAWELIQNSNCEENIREALIAASECPAGRLTAIDKEGNKIEPDLEPSINIIQDPEMGVSSGIYVKGYIPIESKNGEQYEPRSRVMLCRCGRSSNKPFCDATHIPAEFKDKE
ncbi:MAG TPA: iron-binding protein [Clostridiales bacterium]|nr:iron-binding protein [Clostridiales bacterium]